MSPSQSQRRPLSMWAKISMHIARRQSCAKQGILPKHGNPQMNTTTCWISQDKACRERPFVLGLRASGSHRVVAERSTAVVACAFFFLLSQKRSMLMSSPLWDGTSLHMRDTEMIKAATPHSSSLKDFVVSRIWPHTHGANGPKRGQQAQAQDA
eukprot:5682736-Amphidinium_carterae.1